MIVKETPISEKVPVLLINGQSNATGLTEKIPDPQYFRPSVNCKIKGFKGAGDIREYIEFDTLFYPTGNAIGKTNSIEIYVAYMYAKPLYIVKVVKGGTSLALNWRPTSGIRAKVIKHVNEAVEQLEGKELQWFNYWNQWEYDSRDLVESQNYEANLINLFDDYTSSTGVEFKHLIAQVNKNSGFYKNNVFNSELIIQAQINVAAHYGGLVVSTEGVGFHDGVHYTQKGQELMASRVLKIMEEDLNK